MVKDKSKPKGVMSAYAYFVQTIRAEHKKKNPNESVDFAEFSKKCSEKWKTMSAKDKKKYEELSVKDKARHTQEMKSYVPPSGGKGTKRVKDPNKPKKGLSAFFCFCQDERPKVRSAHPDWKVGDVAKELGKRWEKVTNRSKFEAMADADRKRYEKEMAKYNSGGGAKSAKKAKVAAAVEESDDDDDSDDE